MKILRRAIASLFGILLLLTMLAAGLGIWAYQNPGSVFRLVEKYVLPSDLKLEWQTVSLAGTQLGGLNFKIDVMFTGLQISKVSPNLDVPIDRAHLQASIFPVRRTATIHLVQAVATKPITYTAPKNAEPAPAKNPFQQIQSVLAALRMIHERIPIERIDLQADRFVFQSSSGAPLSLQAKVRQQLEEPLFFSVTAADPKDHIQKSPMTVSVNGQLDFKKMNLGEPFVEAEIDFRGFGVATKQDFLGTATPTSVSLISAGMIEYSKNKTRLKFNPKLTAKFTDVNAELQLESSVAGLPELFVKIKTVKLDLLVPLEAGESWSDKPSRFSLAVPVELFFVDKSLRKRLETSCGCKLPTTVVAEASGQVWLETLLSSESGKRPALDAVIKVERILNKMFSIDLAGRLEIEKEADLYRFAPQLNCRATILSLKATRPLLEAYGALVPAPLDVLDGTLAFTAIGPFTRLAEASTFPMSLDVDLSSSSQKVKLKTDATVRLDSQLTAAHFDVSAKVSELNLDLPPLDPLGGLPRVTLDSRFKKSPDAARPLAPKFKLSFSFEVATEQDGAIRLASKYFKPHLPLTLKIQSNGAKENSGFIQSEAFDVTYLRRTVRVEKLRIGLDSDDKGVFPLKGRLIVKQTDYTVFIDVEGTTKKPNVTMSSEPYLPQTDIIAVLLFDRVNDQLVSGDAEAAGGVKAAIADRAIGLFGLWAFAATPIKSFSYNPVSKVYTATVAVSDDLTAGIGTNWEESAHLELRKRVSKRWSLTAAFTPATQEEGSTTKLVLQWEKRF